MDKVLIRVKVSPVPHAPINYACWGVIDKEAWETLKEEYHKRFNEIKGFHFTFVVDFDAEDDVADYVVSSFTVFNKLFDTTPITETESQTIHRLFQRDENEGKAIVKQLTDILSQWDEE